MNIISAQQLNKLKESLPYYNVLVFYVALVF